MGLDVYAYKNVKPLGDADTDGNEISADLRVCHADPTIFAGRCDEFPHGTPLEAEDSIEGYSGGYGRYCHWREQLAKLAGYPLEEGMAIFGGTEWTHSYGAIKAGKGPFWELIWFPDCEGTLGTAVCQKLAKDFAEFEGKAAKEGGTFYDHYMEFKQSFDYASEDGVVDFR